MFHSPSEANRYRIVKVKNGKISVNLIDLESAKKVLTGVGIGCVVMVVGIAYHMQSMIIEHAPPLPVLIVFLLLSIWSFYVALLKKD